MHISIKGLLIDPHLIIKMPVCLRHGWMESSYWKTAKQFPPQKFTVNFIWCFLQLKWVDEIIVHLYFVVSCIAGNVFGAEHVQSSRMLEAGRIVLSTAF